MSNLPTGRNEGNLGGAFHDLVALCLSELRGDLRRLWESNWDEAERLRALAIATTLKEACDRQRLGELACLMRSTASLLCLTRKDALHLRPALREKFDELLNLAYGHVAPSSRRRQSGG